VYCEITKEFIFTDAMRHKYGKMGYPELQTRLMQNELSYVCKENIPIVTYVPNDDCESSLIHPSTISIPQKVCEQRKLTLEQTYWIPLHLSNEWLFTAPTRELFTVMCGTEKYQLTLQKRGKLYLPARCKGYSTHSTLYALSTLIRNNSQDAVLPIASVDTDCRVTQAKREQLHEIPLQKPLRNILSYVEDLKIASVKIDENQELTNAEKAKRNEHFKILTTNWGTIVITIVIFVTRICFSCCCCKFCRQCAFWVRDKWTPKDCVRHTRERCCLVNNFNAERVQYNEIPQTPPLTPGPSHFLSASLQGFQQLQYRKPLESRKRSSSRVSENLELTEFRRKPKSKESK